MSEPSFSQRMGYTPIRDQLQVESMNDELRNGLWNALYLRFLDDLDNTDKWRWHENLMDSIWNLHFKETVDDRPTGYEANAALRSHFFYVGWNEVYDLIEFLALRPATGRLFAEDCNRVLLREGAGYRLIDEKIVQITSEEEIAEIQEALKRTGPLQPVSTHFKTALAHLSNRDDPDYRNSIKESISAVETLCRLIAGKPKVTLSDALKAIGKDNRVKIHAALKDAFIKQYGWTSDDDGIRHSMMDESDLDYEDAKFMLVSCSGFVNYLITKANKAGIELN